jgi:antitoxin FitA
MATLTVKNIPDDVYKRLKTQAARHHRSLNQEIIACLERSTFSVPVDSATFLARAREIRRNIKGPLLTEKRLHQLKTAGRL